MIVSCSIVFSLHHYDIEIQSEEIFMVFINTIAARSTVHHGFLRSFSGISKKVDMPVFILLRIQDQPFFVARSVFVATYLVHRDS